MDKTKNSIGNQIRIAREKLGLTQRELSEKTGIPFRTLQDIEWEKGDPRYSNIKKLAEVLEIGQPDKTAAGSLSSTAIPGPLTAADAAVILARLAGISPERRAMALAIVFDDSTLVPDISLDELVPDSAKHG